MYRKKGGRLLFCLWFLTIFTPVEAKCECYDIDDVDFSVTVYVVQHQEVWSTDSCNQFSYDFDVVGACVVAKPDEGVAFVPC